MTNMSRMTSTRQTDILICGGGVPGLALACLLAQLPAKVTLLEKSPPPTPEQAAPDTRTAALMQGAINILRRAGSWDICREHGEELRTLRIIDDSRAPPLQVDFSAGEIGLPAFGVNMPLTPLRAALWAQAEHNPHIKLIKAGLENYRADETGISATLENGQTLRARLIVGADGRASKVRTIAGIKARSQVFGQSAITALLAHSKPHDCISTEFHRPGGPCTLVPLPGNCSSLVWVERSADAERFIKMSRHALERAIQDRSAGALGKIALAAGPSCFELSGLRATRLTAARAALIAEAAHVLHPLGAQGLNLSLRDVAALAETLADALRLGLDPGSAAVLARYERRRRADIASRAGATNSLNRLLTASPVALSGLRRLGLKSIGLISPLKELAMQEGLAPPDRESRLAAGEAL